MNKTVLDFNNYPDIDLTEFISWFVKKYFKSIEEISKAPLYKGKYGVNILFHMDIENNRYSIELELVDYSKPNSTLFKDKYKRGLSDGEL